MPPTRVRRTANLTFRLKYAYLQYSKLWDKLNVELLEGRHGDLRTSA